MTRKTGPKTSVSKRARAAARPAVAPYQCTAPTPHHAWVEEFPVAITVCDADGVILEMNDKSAKTFEADGGRKLIGTNALDCHPGDSRLKMEELLKNQKVNAYTIEKRGVKKLIYQAPWYRDGKYCGLVELSLEIPFEVPHFVRKG